MSRFARWVIAIAAITALVYTLVPSLPSPAEWVSAAPAAPADVCDENAKPANLDFKVKDMAGKTVSLDLSVFAGWVAVFSPIPLHISEEGRALGTTDSGRILLPPGRHVLTLINTQYGYSTTQTVEIVAGEERAVNVTPKGTVNVNAQPWAEVWVDGQRVGETPIANLEVSLGTREFVFKHPQYGERKTVTTVTSKPSAISIDFTRQN